MLPSTSRAAPAAVPGPDAPRRLDPRAIVYALIPLIAAFVVYRPALRSFFEGDDFTHLVEVGNHGLASVVFRPFMGHLYVVPTLNYYVLLNAVGARPEVFFGFVLVLHLLNVALLFHCIRTLTGSLRLASFGALLWGTYPYHTEALSWFCVHGHVVAGSGFLLAATGLARAVRAGTPVDARRALLWGIALLVAATSFGTGIGPAVLFPLLVLLVRRGRVDLTRGAAIVLRLLPIVIIVGYLTVNRVYARDAATVAPQTGNRARTHTTDLASTPIAFSKGAPQLVALTWGHLFAFGASSLGSGFLWWPLRYPTPGAYALAAALGVGMTVAVVRNRTGKRGWVLGLLVAAGACYALVAIGRGAAVTAMFKAPVTWTASVPRYHYLPTAALTVALCLVLAEWDALLRLGERIKRFLLPAFAVCAVAGFAASSWAINLRTPSRQAVATLLAEARKAAQQAPTNTACIPDRPFLPFGVLPTTPLIWGPMTNAGVFSVFSATDRLLGRSIRYIQDNPAFLASLPPDSRIAEVMVSPDEASRACPPRPAPVGRPPARPLGIAPPPP